MWLNREQSFFDGLQATLDAAINHLIAYLQDVTRNERAIRFYLQVQLLPDALGKPQENFSKLESLSSSAQTSVAGATLCLA